VEILGSEEGDILLWILTIVLGGNELSVKKSFKGSRGKEIEEVEEGRLKK
jgi:hypothetical protein